MGTAIVINCLLAPIVCCSVHEGNRKTSPNSKKWWWLCRHASTGRLGAQVPNHWGCLFPFSILKGRPSLLAGTKQLCWTSQLGFVLEPSLQTITLKHQSTATAQYLSICIFLVVIFGGPKVHLEFSLTVYSKTLANIFGQPSGTSFNSCLFLTECN